jgi:hypothetical protein
LLTRHGFPDVKQTERTESFHVLTNPKLGHQLQKPSCTRIDIAKNQEDVRELLKTERSPLKSCREPAIKRFICFDLVESAELIVPSYKGFLDTSRGYHSPPTRQSHGLRVIFTYLRKMSSIDHPGDNQTNYICPLPFRFFTLPASAGCSFLRRRLAFSRHY